VEPGNAAKIKIPAKPQENGYPSSKIEGSVSDNKTVLQWSKIRHPKFQGYKVVASADNANPRYPDDGYIQYIEDADITSLTVYDGFEGLKAGSSYYFSISVINKDGTVRPGNAVKLTIPDDGTPDAYKISTISGSVTGKKALLKWTRVDHPKFQGYKVVASETNPQPSYPDDGYISYIKNPKTTSLSVTNGFAGLKGGKSYSSALRFYIPTVPARPVIPSSWPCPQKAP
jgi:hypothetical protein